MKIVITGADGFLGWHLRCRLRAHTDHEVVPVGRGQMAQLDEHIRGADVVIHAAGVNRARDTDDLVDGNVRPARELVDAVRRAGKPVQLVYANTIQVGNGTPYAAGKALAADLLRQEAEESGGRFTDVRLPNLFGEHGRPHYNSFVATFCHEVRHGRRPTVTDRAVPLLHVQSAAQVLMDACDNNASDVIEPPAASRLVSDVLELIEEFHRRYATGDIPPLLTDFEVDLFNTYRSVLMPSHYPVPFERHTDTRGELVECVRVHGGGGHTFVSSTLPGITRGEHFHLEKVERFVVVRGEAEIALRRLFTPDIVRFKVSGDQPCAVDMPTMWIHNITNLGTGELVTLFWSNTIFDPARPDTYRATVKATNVTGEAS